MKPSQEARREFLLQAGGAAGAAWLNAQWPAVAAAALHAQEAVKSGPAAKFEVLSPAQARSVETLASQIIPSDELPGAREAGVVFFIDHALKTFAIESVPVYKKGLEELDQLTEQTYPGVKSFADASPEQQQKLTVEFAEQVNSQKAESPRSRALVSADFVQTFWEHTVIGFLADPEAGGNREYAGWRVIGRDPAHGFSPPFGFYDKGYPGWRTASAEPKKP